MPDFISHMRKPVAPATSARHQTTGVKHQRGGSAAPAAELVLLLVLVLVLVLLALVPLLVLFFRGAMARLPRLCHPLAWLAS